MQKIKLIILTQLIQEGDHLTLLKIFREFSSLSSKKSRDWCREHQINHRAMTKAVKINEQLTRAALSQEIKLKSCGEEFELVLRSLVSGFFMNTASKGLDGSYKVFTTGQKLTIHPSSVLFQSPPETVRVFIFRFNYLSLIFLRP